MQKNDKSRVNIFIDGEFAVGLDAVTAVSRRLSVGTEIDSIELNQIVLESEINSAFDKATGKLSSREQSQQELYKYLLSKGYSQQVCDGAIERLKRYSYIDDSRFARKFINDYKHKYGKDYIRFRLRQAGVANDIIDGTLDYAEDANNCAAKYLRTHRNPTKQKLHAYLYNKGYSTESIRAAIDEYADELNAEGKDNGENEF